MEIRPERIRNHPALEGVDLPNTGVRSHAVTLATSTLLISAEGSDGASVLRAGLTRGPATVWEPSKYRPPDSTE